MAAVKTPINTSDATWTLALTGDVMLGRLVNDVMGDEGVLYPWGDTLQTLREADLTFINLECVLSNQGQKWKPEIKPFHFRARPSAVKGLLEAGVDGVNLGNNHALDYDIPALLDTFDVLEKHNIPFVGAGHMLEEALRPIVLSTHGFKVGVFGATDNTPEWAASETNPGVNYMDPINPKTAIPRIRQTVKALRVAGADVVMFSFHWGPNMRESPTQAFIQFAHQVIDAGVDILHGHSAHVFQGVEIYKGKVIFYDTGDFVDDYFVSQFIDQQFIYRVFFEGKKIVKIDFLPVLIDRMQVNLAPDAMKHKWFKRIQKRSEPFGTKFQLLDNRLSLSLQ